MQHARTWIATPADGEATAAADADEPIVRAAQADAAAFWLLYERHRLAVFRYLRTRTPSDEDAADLAATTFERALVGIGGYRERDGAGFRAWLFRIARNVAVDAARRRRPTSALDDEVVLGIAAPAAASDPEATLLAAEHLRDVRRLVAALPEPQREAIVLRFAAGLTAREIGVVIGKSEAAAQKIVTRALLRLKEAYGARD